MNFHFIDESLDGLFKKWFTSPANAEPPAPPFIGVVFGSFWVCLFLPDYELRLSMTAQSSMINDTISINNQMIRFLHMQESQFEKLPY